MIKAGLLKKNNYSVQQTVNSNPTKKRLQGVALRRKHNLLWADSTTTIGLPN